MKKNLKYRIGGILLLLVSTLFNFVSAQVSSEMPPPPPNTGRAVGAGAQSVPIDMYQIFLVAIAIMMIAYFYKKIKLVIN